MSRRAVAGVLLAPKSGKETRAEFLAGVAKAINDCRISTYGDFKSVMNDIFGQCFTAKGINDVSIKNMKNIINMIWFVPYNQIDAIADQIIEQYKKVHPEEFNDHQESEDKNE